RAVPRRSGRARPRTAPPRPALTPLRLHTRAGRPSAPDSPDAIPTITRAVPQAPAPPAAATQAIPQRPISDVTPKRTRAWAGPPPRRPAHAAQEPLLVAERLLSHPSQRRTAHRGGEHGDDHPDHHRGEQPRAQHELQRTVDQ